MSAMGIFSRWFGKTVEHDDGPFQVGDWVRSSANSGIFRVERIANYYDYEFPSHEETLRKVYFCKRFLSVTKRKRFGWVTDTAEWMRPVSEDDLLTINEMLKDKVLAQEFKKFKSDEPCNSLLNIAVEIPSGITKEQLSRQLQSLPAMTTVDILDKIKSLGLKLSDFGWSIQFVSEDYQIRNQHLVYLFRRVL